MDDETKNSSNTENLDDVWADFGNQDIIEPIDYNPKSVAIDVLESFGIEYNDEFTIPNDDDAPLSVPGGPLQGIDLKRVDAYSALKASLTETFAYSDSSGLIEAYVNSYGIVDFYFVGRDISDIHPYYSIMTKSTNNLKKAGVMVTGAKPRQRRYMSDWYTVVGPGADSNYTIHDVSKLMTGNCSMWGINNMVSITYNDPIRGSGSSMWNNGIPEVFEIESPFERIIGYVWYIDPGIKTNTATSILMSRHSSIPVKLKEIGVDGFINDTDYSYTIGDNNGYYPFVGIPRRRASRYDMSLGGYGDIPDQCKYFVGDEIKCKEPYTVPVEIPLIEGQTYEILRGKTFVNKLVGISTVAVEAINLTSMRNIPMPGSVYEEEGHHNTELFVRTNDTTVAIYRLEQGIDYVISYKPIYDSGGNIIKIDPCIQFADNGPDNSISLIGTGVEFIIDYTSTRLVDLFANHFSEQDIPKGKGTVLYKKDGNSGLLVQSVLVQCDLETPCFIISDPIGKANEIANDLVVKVAALYVEDLPRPKAVNGELVNQEDGVVDSDPTTVQEFYKTDMELKDELMSSGRSISFGMGSLTEEQTVRMSRKLYEMFKKDDNSIWVHTCPPTDDPKLGDVGPNGGTINSITYDYSDSGSYLITVTEGPEYFGDPVGIDGGIYYKKTEQITEKGTIIQDRGNHVDYVVRVDGYGDIRAINMCADILAVRDRVSITIYNNEAEG